MRKWRCEVCGYIHIGNEPPDYCPVCGAPKSAFVDAGPAEGLGALAPEIWQSIRPVLFQISYGLYVIGSAADGRRNGATINTFAQMAEDPLRAVMGINKTTLTWELLRKNPVASLSILPDTEDGFRLARHFGLQSGRQADKLAEVPHRTAANGCPVLAQSIGQLELALIPGAELDAGSHTVFLMEIKNGGVSAAGAKPLSYESYQERKKNMAGKA